MLRSVVKLGTVLDMPRAEAVAFWLIRQDGADDPHDDPMFQQWIEADSANGFAWAAACALWESTEVASNSLIGRYSREASAYRASTLWPIAAACAALVVAVGGAWSLLDRWSERPQARRDMATLEQPQEAPKRRYASAIGARKLFRLADGSQVTLNTNTLLSVRVSPAMRRVDLIRGQAFFIVKRDPSRPFIVVAGSHTVTATGTRFDVQMHNREAKVILIEGKVRIADRSGTIQSVNLLAGQQADTEGSAIKVSPANTADTLDWQRGIITFRNTPLSDAVGELNRYSGGKILVIHVPAVGRLRLSGGFHTNDIAKFARTIAELYPVRLVERAETLEIVPDKETR